MKERKLKSGRCIVGVMPSRAFELARVCIGAGTIALKACGHTGAARDEGVRVGVPSLSLRCLRVGVIGRLKD
jgi:hypothetical protein